jgi:hypothetical protein
MGVCLSFELREMGDALDRGDRVRDEGVTVNIKRPILSSLAIHEIRKPRLDKGYELRDKRLRRFRRHRLDGP